MTRKIPARDSVVPWYMEIPPLVADILLAFSKKCVTIQKVNRSMDITENIV